MWMAPTRTCCGCLTVRNGNVKMEEECRCHELMHGALYMFYDCFFSGESKHVIGGGGRGMTKTRRRRDGWGNRVEWGKHTPSLDNCTQQSIWHCALLELIERMTLWPSVLVAAYQAGAEENTDAFICLSRVLPGRPVCTWRSRGGSFLLTEYQCWQESDTPNLLRDSIFLPAKLSQWDRSETDFLHLNLQLIS